MRKNEAGLKRRGEIRNRAQEKKEKGKISELKIVLLISTFFLPFFLYLIFLMNFNFSLSLRQRVHFHYFALRILANVDFESRRFLLLPTLPSPLPTRLRVFSTKLIDVRASLKFIKFERNVVRAANRPMISLLLFLLLLDEHRLHRSIDGGGKNTAE